MAIAKPQYPTIKNILASAARTSTSTASFSMPMADMYTFYVNTTAVSGTSPTLDIVYQTSLDGGTTFIDIPWRHTQITGTGTNFLSVRNGLGLGVAAAEGATADTGGTLAKDAIVDPNNMKVKFTIVATTPSFTFGIWVFTLGDGSSPRTS